MCVYLYVLVYVCMCVFVYVCMYVCVCMYVYVSITWDIHRAKHSHVNSIYLLLLLLFIII